MRRRSSRGPAAPKGRRKTALRAASRLRILGPFDARTAADTDYLRLCERWPAAGKAPRVPGKRLPDVPALLLSGAEDLRTPLELARDVAKRFPQADVVRVPRTGHVTLGAHRTAAEAAVHFLTGGD